MARWLLLLLLLLLMAGAFLTLFSGMHLVVRTICWIQGRLLSLFASWPPLRFMTASGLRRLNITAELALSPPLTPFLSTVFGTFRQCGDVERVGLLECILCAGYWLIARVSDAFRMFATV